MRAATLAENAIISVLHGQYRRSTYLREAHEHGRNDGVTGWAVGVVLADFIFKATTSTRIDTVKCVVGEVDCPEGGGMGSGLPRRWRDGQRG